MAISRILGCRSSAVLPEGMSRERFEWLERWVTEKADIVKTFGTETDLICFLLDSLGEDAKRKTHKVMVI